MAYIPSERASKIIIGYVEFLLIHGDLGKLWSSKGVSINHGGGMPPETPKGHQAPGPRGEFFAPLTRNGHAAGDQGPSRAKPAERHCASARTSGLQSGHLSSGNGLCMQNPANPENDIHHDELRGASASRKVHGSERRFACGKLLQFPRLLLSGARK